MADPFDEAFALQEYLQQNARLIPDATLYDVDDGQLLASALENLAQPLPDGTPSPFSSKAPTAGHALLISQIVYLQSLLAHRFNSKLSQEYIRHLRMLGIETAFAEYPIIEVLFRGDVGALVPVSTEIRSQVTAGLSAYTTRPVTVGTDGTATVPARMNRAGPLGSLRSGEMTILPRSLSKIKDVVNTGVVLNPGRNRETLTEAVLRGRDLLQTGRRCVTPKDFLYWAKNYGAEAVNIVRGDPLLPGSAFADLVTLVVYPDIKVPVIHDAIVGAINDGAPFDGTLADERVNVIPAEIIPVTGTITVGADSHLSSTQVFNKVVNAITTKINPPNGQWGDRTFLKSLSTAIELEEGIYSVPSLELRHESTAVSTAELTPQPYQLFEVQASTQIIQA